MAEDKVENAREFIDRIRTMDPKQLTDMILRMCGDEQLPGFFVHYARSIVLREPERILENTASLMLMGYLLAKDEMTTKHQPMMVMN
jgi:hypothetical protein